MLQEQGWRAQTPNWIGAHGIPAIGEQAAAEVIAYGVPDIRGIQAAEYAGKSVLVIGSGHSALNALQDLIALADHEEGMRIVWGVRCANIDEVIRPAPNDELEERKALELRIKALLEEGRIEVVTGLAVEAIDHQAGRWVVQSGEHRLPAVDRIIAATGFRPSLELLSELRVSLDPATQSPIKLAPLIDPNQHSCGSVPEQKNMDNHNLTEKQLVALLELVADQGATANAWIIKEKLRWIRRASTARGARWRITNYLKVMCEAVAGHTLLKPMAKALDHYMNGLFQAARSRARGYRNESNFIAMIYLIGSPVGRMLDEAKST